jgi:ATP-binding cassette subfamily B protein
MGGFGMPTQKARNFWGTLFRLFTYFRGQIWLLVIVVLTAIAGTTFTIVGPKILALATNKLVEGITRKFYLHIPGAEVDFTYIGQIMLLLLGLYLLSFLFGYVQQFAMAGVAQRTVYRLRRDVDEKLARLPLRYYDTKTHGEIMSRAVNDLDNVSNTLQQNVTQSITAVVTVVGIIIMMFTINWLLSVVVLLSVPLSLGVTGIVASRAQRYFANQQRALGELNGHVEEMYTGHRIVKAFGRERQSVATFTELNGKLYNAGWRAQFVSGMIFPLLTSLGNISYVSVTVVGAILLAQSTIQAGDLLAFIQYAQRFSQPITQLGSIANTIQLTIASAERVFDLLDEQEEIADAKGEVPLPSTAGQVQFAHVSFSYNAENPLIVDMNLEARPGQTVAIVGPTGAGKTTLVNLLMRFYDVDAGAILVDGVDIRELPRGELRRMFGMVLQDTWLFNGTIRENIAYGRENATEDEIQAAARAAQADHFIRTLDHGYDTVLNQDATNLSQGQKQLLTIARAVLADPKVLILDEATSSVDTRTELLIQSAMTELMRGRTSFVIAHRLSTVREASVILVMNHGSIVEQGTHEELLAKGGFYAELYNSQFARAFTEEAVS